MRQERVTEVTENFWDFQINFLPESTLFTNLNNQAWLQPQYL